MKVAIFSSMRNILTLPGKIVIEPGLNYVDSELYDACKEHPAVLQLLKDEQLSVKGEVKEEPEVEEISEEEE